MKSIRRWTLLLVGAGLVACSSDSRNEPTPAAMCQNLATECSGFRSETLNECKRIGERGQDDPSAEDQCYVYYDTCIDQCRFYREFGEGTDSDAGSDAGLDSGLAPGDGADAATNGPASDSGAPGREVDAADAG